MTKPAWLLGILTLFPHRYFLTSAAVNQSSYWQNSGWSQCDSGSVYQLQSVYCINATNSVTLHTDVNACRQIIEPDTVRPCSTGSSLAYDALNSACYAHPSLTACLSFSFCGWCIDRATTRGRCLHGSEVGPSTHSPLCADALWIASSLDKPGTPVMLQVDAQGFTPVTHCYAEEVFIGGLILAGCAFVIGVTWCIVKYWRQRRQPSSAPISEISASSPSDAERQLRSDATKGEPADRSTILLNPLIRLSTAHVYQALKHVFPSDFQLDKPRSIGWILCALLLDLKALVLFEISSVTWLTSANSRSVAITGSPQLGGGVLGLLVFLFILLTVEWLILEIRSRKEFYYAFLQLGVVIDFNETPIYLRTRFVLICALSIVMFGQGFQLCDYSFDWVGLQNIGGVIYFSYTAILFEETLLPWSKVLQQPANVARTRSGWNLLVVPERSVALYLRHRVKQGAQRKRERDGVIRAMMQIRFGEMVVQDKRYEEFCDMLKETMVISRDDLEFFLSHEIENTVELSYEWHYMLSDEDAESNDHNDKATSGKNEQDNGSLDKGLTSVVVKCNRGTIVSTVNSADTLFQKIVALARHLWYGKFTWDEVAARGKRAIFKVSTIADWWAWNHYAMLSRHSFYLAYNDQMTAADTGDLNDLQHSVRQAATVALNREQPELKQHIEWAQALTQTHGKDVHTANATRRAAATVQVNVAPMPATREIRTTQVMPDNATTDTCKT